jgi:flagellar motor switch protein FliN/FliY
MVESREDGQAPPLRSQQEHAALADDNEGLLDQSEIEALFGALAKESAPTTANPPPSAASVPSAAGSSTPADIPGVDPNLFQVKPFNFQELGGGPGGGGPVSDINLIADVDLNVRIELGRTRMYIEEVLTLREGSIVPLDKLAGDPVDIYVNGQLLARGEVLVLNDNFCVRVSEIIGEKQPPGIVETS